MENPHYSADWGPTVCLPNRNAQAGIFWKHMRCFGHGFVSMNVVVLALLLYVALLSQSPPPTTISRGELSAGFCTMSGKSIHNLTVKDIHGNDVGLGNYKGKVLLIVNVASQWSSQEIRGRTRSKRGHRSRLALQQITAIATPLKGIKIRILSSGLTTTNYKELNQLYRQYKDHGFEILAFPCNQFGGQEPGTNEEIVEVACRRFKAEFPIFDKVEVNGDNAAPIYKFLKTSKGGIFGDRIKWNFTKFLVDKDGCVVDRYAPMTSPSKIEKDIKQLLGVA